LLWASFNVGIGAGYTGIGITNQDLLIFGNLLVTGAIDPTYLALAPQTSGPTGFSNPLWLDNTEALRTENIIASGKFIGDLSGNATSVVVNDASDNSTYYPIFVNGSGNKPISADITTNPLTYNPSTNNLTATLFVGDLSGNFSGSITNATNASNSNITDTNNDSTYYPTFVDGSGNKPLGADISTGPLTYNPNTGQLGCQRVSSTGNIIAGGLFVGGLTGTINVTDTNINATYYPTFVDGSGNKSLGADISTGPLTYNPSTGTLTTTQLKYSTGITGYVPVSDASGLLSLQLQIPKSIPAIGYPLGSNMINNGYGYNNSNISNWFTTNGTKTGNAIYLPQGKWLVNYKSCFTSINYNSIYQYGTYLGSQVNGLDYGQLVSNYPTGVTVNSFTPFCFQSNNTSIVTAGAGGLTLYMSNSIIYPGGNLSGGQRLYAVSIT
jgi:hypothetical protein